jgi:hypothetical protein
MQPGHAGILCVMYGIAVMVAVADTVSNASLSAANIMSIAAGITPVPVAAGTPCNRQPSPATGDLTRRRAGCIRPRVPPLLLFTHLPLPCTLWLLYARQAAAFRLGHHLCRRNRLSSCVDIDGCTMCTPTLVSTPPCWLRVWMPTAAPSFLRAAGAPRGVVAPVAAVSPSMAAEAIFAADDVQGYIRCRASRAYLVLMNQTERS